MKWKSKACPSCFSRLSVWTPLCWLGLRKLCPEAAHSRWTSEGMTELGSPLYCIGWATTTKQETSCLSVAAADFSPRGSGRPGSTWGALGVGGDPSWKEGLPFLSSSVDGWWADIFTGGVLCALSVPADARKLDSRTRDWGSWMTSVSPRGPGTQWGWKNWMKGGRTNGRNTGRQTRPADETGTGPVLSRSQTLHWWAASTPARGSSGGRARVMPAAWCGGNGHWTEWRVSVFIPTCHPVAVWPWLYPL